MLLQVKRRNFFSSVACSYLPLELCWGQGRRGHKAKELVVPAVEMR